MATACMPRAWMVASALLHAAAAIESLMETESLQAAIAADCVADADMEGRCISEGELESLSLRQLRGERQTAEGHAHVHEHGHEAEVASSSAMEDEGSEVAMDDIGSEPLATDCRATRQYCDAYMTYGLREHCEDDPTCQVLDVGDFGGEKGKAWLCRPADQEECPQETPEKEDFKSHEEIPEEFEDEAVEEEDSAADMNITMKASYSSGSCIGHDCHSFYSYATCQCNSRCSDYGNCCSDYSTTCQMQHEYHSHVGGRTMTLYHTTSRAAAEAIVRTGFRPGHTGWCGGAIYFINHPYLPKTKYAPGITQTGAILEAKVSMGRMAYMNRHCKGYGGTGTGVAKRLRFNSLKFNPGDGDEYIIWHSSQVNSVRIYRYT